MALWGWSHGWPNNLAAETHLHHVVNISHLPLHICTVRGERVDIHFRALFPHPPACSSTAVKNHAAEWSSRCCSVAQYSKAYSKGPSASLCILSELGTDAQLNSMLDMQSFKHGYAVQQEAWTARVLHVHHACCSHVGQSQYAAHTVRSHRDAVPGTLPDLHPRKHTEAMTYTKHRVPEQQPSQLPARSLRAESSRATCQVIA